MRKYLSLFLTAVLCGLLVACNDGGAPKIGVMDMNRLLRESAPGKAGLQYIEQQQEGLQERMEEIQGKLEKNPKDAAAQQELQKLFMEAQQQVQGDGQAVVGALLEAIQKVVDQFRQTHGYLAIIRVEALDSFDPSLDVTNQMMKEVDKLQLDFKQILANQPAAATPLEIEEMEPEAKEPEAKTPEAKTAAPGEDAKPASTPGKPQGKTPEKK